MRPLLLSVALAAALAGCSVAPATADTANQATQGQAEAKAEKLDALYEAYWEEYLKLNPITATFQGDPRYNAELPDFGSQEYRDDFKAFTEQWLAKVEAVGSEGLTGSDLINYEIFVTDAKETLASYRFPGWMLPVNQMDSIASFAVQLGSGTGAQPFKTVEDYDNWLARAGRLPVLFDTSIANMRAGCRTPFTSLRRSRAGSAPALSFYPDPAIRYQCGLARCPVSYMRTGTGQNSSIGLALTRPATDTTLGHRARSRGRSADRGRTCLQPYAGDWAIRCIACGRDACWDCFCSSSSWWCSACWPRRSCRSRSRNMTGNAIPNRNWSD